MKRYRVRVFLSGSKTVEVEAFDKDHARIKALRAIRLKPDGGCKFLFQVDEIEGVNNES